MVSMVMGGLGFTISTITSTAQNDLNHHQELTGHEDNEESDYIYTYLK